MKTKQFFLKKWIIIAFLAICCFFSAIGGATLWAKAADTTTGMTFGTDYVYSARKTSTEPLRTFEATINAQDPSNNKYGGVILGNYRTNGSYGFRFEIGENGASDDKGYPNLYIKDYSNIVHNFAFTEVGVFGVGKTHVTIVLDDDAAKCYINGELKQSIDYTGETPFMPVVTAGNSMQLGGDGDAWRRFRGEIFDAAIYTDVRTAAEIAADMANPNGDNLLLAYEVTSADSNASAIADKSGNGFDLVKQVTWINSADKAALNDYDYSFAIVGDPQIMNANYADAFNGIFSWINNNATAKKINQVMVLGDVVDSSPTSTEEWSRGQTALNGLTVPYNLIRGNHDGFLSGQSTDTFDEYYGGTTKYAQSVTGYYAAGGTYANAYRTFEVCGVPYLVMMLDYGPSDAVLNWAGDVISENPDRNVIVMTHSYLSVNGTTEAPDNNNCPSGTTYGNDGTEIWNKLIRKHENIVMVLSGHEGADQVVMTQRQGDNGNTVTEFLIDPQELDNKTDGGTGMVTMMYFSDNGRTVQLETYSTVKGQYYMTTNQFSFELDASTQNTPELLYGASVRCDSISGIRFSAYVKEDVANTEGNTYGFFLARNSATKTWSMDELTAENQAKENSGIAKLVSTTWALSSDKNNKDGYKLYNAVITGLPTDVYGTEFVARAFMKDASGKYYYSDAISTRSIAQVANMALNDSDYVATLGTSQKSTLQTYVDTVVGGSSLTLNANTLTFASIGGVQKLTANTQMVSYASANENIVTVDKDGVVRAFGEGSTTITAVMGSQTQTVNVIVNGNTGKKVTKFIRTVDDFYSIMNATSGYYVLENDIYLGSYKPGDVTYEKDYSYYEYHPTVSFGGTLDGNGYTIHYTHVGRHSVYLFQTLTNTAIVKNCNINVSYYNNTNVHYVRAAALAYENKGMIENVYVNALVSTPGQGHGDSVYEKFAKAGLVIVNSGTIQDVVVNMTYTGDDLEHLNGICAVDNGTLKNTAFIRNNTGISVVNSGTTDGNVNTYESVEAFANGYDSFVNGGFAGSNYPLVKTALSDVEYEYFVGEATDLTISGISGTIASVKLGGEEVAYTDNSGSVTVSASVMEGKNGKNEFVITTDTSIYTVTANVLKKIKISTVEDFVAIENDMTGYYVLVNDLSIYSGGGTDSNFRFLKPLGYVEQNKNPGTNVPFTGTLDGNGYTLTYNYAWGGNGSNHDKSLFYIIGTTGVVKNLCLNVTEGVGGGTARTAALAWINNGTIENVYTKISFSHNASGANEAYGAAGLVVSNYGTINNCIVDYSHTLSSGTMPAVVVAMNNAGGNITNTAAIVTCGTTINYQNTNNGATDNTPMYTSVAAFAEDFENFKSAGYTGTNYPKLALPTVELSDVEYEYFVGEATDLTISGISGTVANVKLGGEEVAYTDNNGSVTVSASVMEGKNGKNEFVITTDTSIYTVTVNVLKKIKISTLEDFVAIENDMTGYYVLVNDLSIYSGGGTDSNFRFLKPLGYVEQNKNPGTNVPFTGTLDGNGYTLTYNYAWGGNGSNHDKSLFYIIGTTGVVKNLCLNVTEGVGGGTARTAALAWINNGTIENVYTKISFSHNASGANEAYGAAGLVVSNYGTINNCIVDYSHSLSSGTMPAAVVAMNNAGGNITNTAAIVTCGTTISYQNVNSGTKDNTPIYTSYGDFFANKNDFIAAGYTGTLYPTALPIVELSDVEYEYFAGEATDLTISGISGTIASVKLGDEDVAYTDNSGSVTIASNVMTELANGTRDYTITTSTCIYTVTVNVLKKIKISTLEDFVAIENDMTAYYVLANDLSIYSGGGTSANLRFNKPLGFVQSNVNPGTNVPFTGMLDGNGHTLTYNYSWGGPGSNNHDKSLFYIIGTTGVVKNLCLNVTEGVGGGTARTAALAWINNGTIENVYTKISFSHNASGANEAYGAAGLVVSNYGTINNCIVDYSHTLSSGTMPAVVVAMNNAGGNITNTAAIVTCGTTINYQNVNSGTKDNTPIYTSYSDFYAEKDSFISSGFVVGSFWTIGESGITFGN